jgi:hypothetical protein
MDLLRATGRQGLWLLALLVIAGCSGIEPFELTNTREEGPEKGLFSGPGGEFVIHGRADQPVSVSEDEPVAGEVTKE